MKRKAVSILLACVLSLSMAACEGNPSAGNEKSVEESAEGSGAENSAEGQGEDTPQGQEKPTGDEQTISKENILFQGYYADVYYGLDPDGKKVSEYNWKEIREELKKKGQDFTDVSVSAMGDGALFLYRYEYVGDRWCYRVYAIDAESKEVQEIWTSPQDWWLDGIDYYKGKLYLTVSTEDFVEEEYVYQKDATGFHFTSVDNPYKQAIANMEGYNLTIYSPKVGNRYRNCSITRSLEESGYVVGYKDQSYFKLEKDGSNSLIVGMTKDYVYVMAYDKDAIIYSANDDENQTSGVYCTKYSDAGTSVLVQDASFFSFLTYADGKAYYSVTSNDNLVLVTNEVDYYDVADGKDHRLYLMESTPGAADVAPGIQGFQVLNGQIYFMKPNGDKITWVRVDQSSDPATFQDLGLVVGEKSAFRYGTVIYNASSTNCKFCGTPLTDKYQEVFQLDSKYSAQADKINELLCEDLKWVLEEGESTWDQTDEYCDEHRENPYVWCETMEEEVTGAGILSDRYLTVDYGGYWYGGGAHGMASMSQRVFDLTTGKELSLKDFYEGSEESFKEIVAQKTKEDYLTYEGDEMMPYFAQDEQSVYDEAYEMAGFEKSNVIFGEEGINVVYAPYDMGPYASGFIILSISYEELLGRPTL